jgi:hypothetical protein
MSKRFAALIRTLLLGSIAAESCTYLPTEAIVSLDTDLPSAQPVEIFATVNRPGSQLTKIQARWVRGASSSFDGGVPIVFPASFTVVPAENEPRDTPVEVHITANVAPVTSTDRAYSIHRLARFRLTPRQPTSVRIFLAERRCDLFAGRVRLDGQHYKLHVR